MATLKPVTGNFVLAAPSGDFKFDGNNDVVNDARGAMVLDNPETVYYESSAGEGKANYWTDDVSKAHIFKDIESAVRKLIETNRSYSPVRILQLCEIAEEA